MPVFTFPQEMALYPDEWVALSHDLTRVVGHGQTGMDAMAMADEVREKNAVLIFNPSYWPDTVVF